MTVVDVRDVTIRYGRNVAVDRVTFSVESGSVYALLGRNGAGKSSLVRCIVGQQRPAAGSVALFERDAWKHRQSLMERTGVVAEDADAPPEMTVAQIERFCSRIYATWDSNAAIERLRRFNISPSSKFGTLSKGQRKQIALVMALAMSPELVILDDPTLGLDVVARRSLFEEVVGELADRGITVVITTHDLAGVEAIANRVAILAEGRLV
ncbi:MAG: ABC transporter ATP-binding protein, partial [Thermoanaerobaculia bacterium]